MDKEKSIKLKCLFCFSTDFALPEENYTPQPGEMIQCANCGKMNDYDSLMRVAEREGLEWAEGKAEKLVGDMMKKIGKGWKI